MFRLVVWRDKLCIADGCPESTFLCQGHHRHASLILDTLQVKVKSRLNLWALPNDVVVDLNLVLDADTRSLSQSLDTIRDLARDALELEFLSELGVKHDSGGALRLAAPSLVILGLLCELFDDFEHAGGDLVAVDVDATFAQVTLDLIISQIG